MREDWEVRKWNEVLSIVNGKNQKGVENNNGFYPIYGSGGIMGYADNFLCPENTVIIGRKGNINKPIFVKEKFWNVDTAFGLISKSGILDSKFLFYFCVSYNFEKLNKAVTIPSLTKSDLLNIKIDLPPLQTQHQIVEELDSLTSIIEKQKKQLEELDNLAQAVFYDMFGDPIENEKGWGKEKITKVAPIEQYQGDILENNGMYWLLNLDMIQSNKRTILEKVYVQYDEVGTSTIKFNKDNVLYSKLRPYLNKVVIPDDSGFCTSELVPFKPNESIILKIFLCSVLSHKSFVNYISSKVIGAKMPRVSMDVLRGFNVITPPLTLQQQFASKIEAIEKQKELIKKSIKETEDLFNSRMDYYFN